MSITMGPTALIFGDGSIQNWASAIKGASYSTVLSPTSYNTGFSIVVPPGTCMITMNFADVSLTGTDNIAFRFYLANSLSPTYSQQIVNVNNGSVTSGSSSTVYPFAFISGGTTSANIFSGTMNFWLDTGPYSPGSSSYFNGLFKHSTTACQFISGHLNYDTTAITDLGFYPTGSSTFDGGVVNFTQYTSFRG